MKFRPTLARSARLRQKIVDISFNTSYGLPIPTNKRKGHAVQLGSETPSFARRIPRMSPDRGTRLRRWGKSLKDRISGKKLNQSEFASRVAIHTRDGKMGRDLVSNYIRGVSEPTPLKQIAMAKALGITVEELMAPMNAEAEKTSETTSQVEMTSIGHNLMRLRIEKNLPLDVALQILDVMNKALKDK